MVSRTIFGLRILGLSVFFIAFGAVLYALLSALPSPAFSGFMLGMLFLYIVVLFTGSVEGSSKDRQRVVVMNKEDESWRKKMKRNTIFVFAGLNLLALVVFSSRIFSFLWLAGVLLCFLFLMLCVEGFFLGRMSISGLGGSPINRSVSGGFGSKMVYTGTWGRILSIFWSITWSLILVFFSHSFLMSL